MKAQFISLISFCVITLYVCSSAMSAARSEDDVTKLEQQSSQREDTRQTGSTIIYRVGEGMVPTTYEIVNDLAVYEGDIILGTHAELSAAHQGDFIAHGLAVETIGELWPGGTLPYVLDPTLPLSTRLRVGTAMRHWRESTDIEFVERTASNANQYPNFAQFVPSENCASYVGMRGFGGQNIFLNTNCTVGNIIHEIGHALGLWHEQSREDRDVYVRILWENILPGREHNFYQQIANADDVGEYDFASIMHYGNYAFTRNGQPTIIVLVPGTVIGQRNKLSVGDINTVQSLYAFFRECENHHGELLHQGGYELIAWGYRREGILAAQLEGVSGTDFDLYLERYDWAQRQWLVVASSLSVGSLEAVDYEGEPGWYAWRVVSYRGSGAYTLCVTQR